MTFDENTATSLQIWSLLFLKPQSRELNLSNKMLKVKIGCFYEAVRWLKVWSNMRIWADMGNTKDIAGESQKIHHHRKKSKISKLSLSMAHIFCGKSELGIYAIPNARVCADSTHSRFPRWTKFSCHFPAHISNSLVNPLYRSIYVESEHENFVHRGNRLCVESAQTLALGIA